MCENAAGLLRAQFGAAQGTVVVCQRRRGACFSEKQEPWPGSFSANDGPPSGS